MRALLFRAMLPLAVKNQEFKQLHKYYTAGPINQMQSITALFGKLIRIFYAVMTKDVEYNPEKMLQDIHRLKDATQAA